MRRNLVLVFVMVVAGSALCAAGQVTDRHGDWVERMAAYHGVMIAGRSVTSWLSQADLVDRMIRQRNTSRFLMAQGNSARADSEDWIDRMLAAYGADFAHARPGATHLSSR